MHLSQTAALTMVADQPPETGHAAPQTGDGGGFQSIFAGPSPVESPRPGADETAAADPESDEASTVADLPMTEAGMPSAVSFVPPHAGLDAGHDIGIVSGLPQGIGTGMPGAGEVVAGSAAGDAMPVRARGSRSGTPDAREQAIVEGMAAGAIVPQEPGKSSTGDLETLPTSAKAANGWDMPAVGGAALPPAQQATGAAPAGFPVPHQTSDVERAGKVDQPVTTPVTSPVTKPVTPELTPTAAEERPGSWPPGRGPGDPVARAQVAADARTPVAFDGSNPLVAPVAGPQGMADPVPGEAGLTDRMGLPDEPVADRAVIAAAGQGRAASGASMPRVAGEKPDGFDETRGRRDEADHVDKARGRAASDVGGAEAASMPRSTPGIIAAPGAETGVAATGVGAGLPAAAEGLLDADPVVLETGLGELRATARGSATATVPVHQAPETPRLVAVQIAEVLRASGDRAVELRLQPEELGRVHLTMSQDATGTLTVSLTAERAETLDLLRRNIDLLGAELRELGYGSIDFSFQGDDPRRQAQGPERDVADDVPQTGTAAPEESPVAAGAGHSNGPGAGIDLRL